MDKLEKARELLKKYIKNTPKDVLNQISDKYNKVKQQGNTLDNYFALFENDYTIFDNKSISVEIIVEHFENTSDKWVETFSSQKTEAICLFEEASILVEFANKVDFLKDNDFPNDFPIAA